MERRQQRERALTRHVGWLLKLSTELEHRRARLMTTLQAMVETMRGTAPRVSTTDAAVQTCEEDESANMDDSEYHGPTTSVDASAAASRGLRSFGGHCVALPFPKESISEPVVERIGESSAGTGKLKDILQEQTDKETLPTQQQEILKQLSVAAEAKEAALEEAAKQWLAAEVATVRC